MALTAAHKTLPFGTMLRVTNPQNGKQVVVRINDRGPYIKGRDLDLSKGAALQLGMIEKGVIKVEIEKLVPQYSSI
jgi:rare lipoprotein A